MPNFERYSAKGARREAATRAWTRNLWDVRGGVFEEEEEEEEEIIRPAVARAVWPGRCWLRARCRFRVEGALPVLVLSSTLLAI
jgi:hypothetical protein